MADFPIPRRRDQPQLNASAPANDVPERKKIPILDILDRVYFNGGSDALANSEASALASGNLEKEAAQNEHLRSEAAKGQIHTLGLRAILAAWVGLMAIAGVWLYHLLMPDAYHFVPHVRVRNRILARPKLPRQAFSIRLCQ